MSTAAALIERKHWRETERLAVSILTFFGISTRPARSRLHTFFSLFLYFFFCLCFFSPQKLARNFLFRRSRRHTRKAMIFAKRVDNDFV